MLGDLAGTSFPPSNGCSLCGHAPMRTDLADALMRDDLADTPMRTDLADAPIREGLADASMRGRRRGTPVPPTRRHVHHQRGGSGRALL
eukprot:355295-Chlamydomonas_euryale.AAC.2